MKFEKLKDLQKCLEYAGICDLRVYYFESVGSTNTAAREMILSGLKENLKGFVVVAEEQTAGRGRFSRKWMSEKDASVCLSGAFPIEVETKALESVTIRAGTEICARLRERFKADVYVKWPNDIYSKTGKKLCGILADFYPSPDGNAPHWCVIGVGLNLDFGRSNTSLPSELNDISGDLKSVSGCEYISQCEAAAAIVSGIREAVRKTATQAKDLKKLFGSMDWLRGKTISLNSSGNILNGRAEGIDDTGKLVLLTKNGPIKVGNGEASLVRSAF